MKLYYAPGVCSIGIHVLLEEIGKPYQLELVNLREGAQFKPPYTGVTPKGKVPALERDDGSVLTEFPVIARWLGKQANLLPKDDEADTRAMEAMEYAVSTMHGQGFARLFRTERFAPSASDHEAVKAAGREVVEKGFACSTTHWPARTISPAMNSRLLIRRYSTSNSGRQSVST